MELYKELGIRDGMSSSELASVLAQDKQQCISMLNHPDLRMQQAAQQRLRILEKLIGAESKLGGKAENPALVLRTLAAGLEMGNPQYARYEETVLAIANKELSAAYLKAPMNYLMSVGAEEEYAGWEEYLRKRGARVFMEDGRITRISRSDQSSKRRTTPAQRSTGQVRKAAAGSSSGKRTGRPAGSASGKKAGTSFEIPFLKDIPYLRDIPPRILAIAAGALLALIVLIVLVGKIRSSSEQRKEEAAAQAQQEAQQETMTEEEAQQAAITSALQGLGNYTVLTEGAFNESDYAIIMPVNCEASSMLVGQSGKVYGTEFLFDRTVETSWQEGEADEGLGTTIYAEFPENTRIKAIGLWPGNQVSEEKFKANNRPTQLTFSAAYADQTYSTDVQLQDIMGEQLILFENSVPVDNILMTIKAVASGAVYNDTVISEMTFYTDKP